jgi:outer membrane protein OmpA-like peptidoglycan-associated protein
MSTVLSTKLRFALSALLTIAVASCANTTTPVPEHTMEFEDGIRALGANLAGQLEKSSIGDMLKRVNPLTKQKGTKKISIDPFIDVESGYPVKVNARIIEILSVEMRERVNIAGAMEPDNLEVSEYVLNGMVTLERDRAEEGRRYKVTSSVFEKFSGKVLASSSVRVGRFDTAPMEIYKDSPVFLKGKDYEELTSSVKKEPGEKVEEGYHDKLALKSMNVKGDMLYEQGEYKKSLSYYDQAASSQSRPQIQVLNGQFTNLVRQAEWDRAEVVYAKLIRASIAETGNLASKITYSPNSFLPIEGKAAIYGIYIRQIAKLVAAVPTCRIKIIGHSSRTGDAAYNDALSLQRSVWILKEMSSYAAGIGSKAETSGRGFKENIVGTGTDDVRDEIDRRVEFKFTQCVE